MKKIILTQLLVLSFIWISMPHCKKINEETSTLAGKAKEQKSAEQLTAKPLLEIRFDMTGELEDHLNKHNSSLEALRQEICAEVDQLTHDVHDNGDGTLSYPDWVRFAQIAEAIDLLNEKWNEAYGQALDNSINVAISSGATDVDSEDEQGKDFLSDVIEEQHLMYPEDIASVCFEEKFNFTSLRKCLQEQEEEWLETTTAEGFNAGEAPTIREEIEDEEFWTLMSCDRGFTIENTTIEPSMFDQTQTNEEKAEIIATIREIAEIIGIVVGIGEALNDLLEDCGGSTRAKEKDLRDGITIPGEQAYIGYVMVQKGQTFDWANATYTKIKGKAKLYKIKNNGKGKRDRRNKASIGFCAKEGNGCQGGDWPSDVANYFKPHVDGRGKQKVKHREPKALTIDKSYHFLQFRFGKNGNFVQALNLLGGVSLTSSITNGCRMSGSDW